MTGAGSSIGGVSSATGNNGSDQRASGSGLVQHTPPTLTPKNIESTSVMRWFRCGETGHHQANCKKQGKKAFL